MDKYKSRKAGKFHKAIRGKNLQFVSFEDQIKKYERLHSEDVTVTPTCQWMDFDWSYYRAVFEHSEPKYTSSLSHLCCNKLALCSELLTSTIVEAIPTDTLRGLVWRHMLENRRDTFRLYCMFLSAVQSSTAIVAHDYRYDTFKKPYILNNVIMGKTNQRIEIIPSNIDLHSTVRFLNSQTFRNLTVMSIDSANFTEQQLVCLTSLHHLAALSITNFKVKDTLLQAWKSSISNQTVHKWGKLRVLSLPTLEDPTSLGKVFQMVPLLAYFECSFKPSSVSKFLETQKGNVSFLNRDEVCFLTLGLKLQVINRLVERLDSGKAHCAFDATALLDIKISYTVVSGDNNLSKNGHELWNPTPQERNKMYGYLRKKFPSCENFYAPSSNMLVAKNNKRKRPKWGKLSVGTNPQSYFGL